MQQRQNRVPGGSATNHVSPTRCFRKRLCVAGKPATTPDPKMTRQPERRRYDFACFPDDFSAPPPLPAPPSFAFSRAEVRLTSSAGRPLPSFIDPHHGLRSEASVKTIAAREVVGRYAVREELGSGNFGMATRWGRPGVGSRTPSRPRPESTEESTLPGSTKWQQDRSSGERPGTPLLKCRRFRYFRDCGELPGIDKIRKSSRMERPGSATARSVSARQAGRVNFVEIRERRSHF